MDVTPALPQGAKSIDSYGDGGFRVAGERFEGAVIVTPTAVSSWMAGAPCDLGAHEAQAVAQAVDGAELVLIGSGARPVPLPKAFREALTGAGVRVDVMDTGAACRTYSVLLAEGRSVAAALVAV